MNLVVNITVVGFPRALCDEKEGLSLSVSRTYVLTAVCMCKCVVIRGEILPITCHVDTDGE